MYVRVLLFGVAIVGCIIAATGASLTAETIAKLLLCLMLFGLLLAFLMIALRPRTR